jgi:hypothetical protein
VAEQTPTIEEIAAELTQMAAALDEDTGDPLQLRRIDPIPGSTDRVSVDYHLLYSLIDIAGPHWDACHWCGQRTVLKPDTDEEGNEIKACAKGCDG